MSTELVYLFTLSDKAHASWVASSGVVADRIPGVPHCEFRKRADGRGVDCYGPQAARQALKGMTDRQLIRRFERGALTVTK